MNTMSSLQESKVLVIDDDEGCRAFLTTLLSCAGYKVHELTNGKDVGVFISAIPVDAIITDLFMPGVDGLETIRVVKELAPSMPVIGVTGAEGASIDCYIRAMTLFGAAAVLLKPFDGDALLSILSEAITRKTGTPGANDPSDDATSVD